HHRKVPVEICPRRDVRDRITQGVQVPIDRDVADDRQLRVHLLRLLRPDLDLLLLRYSAARQERPGKPDRNHTPPESSHTSLTRERRPTPQIRARKARHIPHMKLLTLARDLQRRKSRERQGMFVAEGIRTVEALLESSLPIRGAIVAPQLAETPRGATLRERL